MLCVPFFFPLLLDIMLGTFVLLFSMYSKQYFGAERLFEIT